MIEACVVSAALSPSASPGQADVSATLRITNQTADPLELAMCTDMDFTPENAPGLTPMNTNYIQMSGMSGVACVGNFAAASTAFAPGRALLVQIRYPAMLSGDAIQMLRSASMASFTVSLFETIGDRRTLVPLPASEFRFSNGFAKRQFGIEARDDVKFGSL
jgi:hypothetical protein